MSKGSHRAQLSASSGINLFGLVIESPIRTTYHFLCSAGWCAVQPCFLFKPDSPAAKCSAHHYLTVQEYYYFLQHVLCANVQRPQPASLYLEDYRYQPPATATRRLER